jgi:hypothetical protein
MRSTDQGLTNAKDHTHWSRLLTIDTVYYAIELNVINGIRGPSRLRSLDRVLKEQSRAVGLPDPLRLPEGVVMNANASLEDGARGVEQNPSPKPLLVENGKIRFDFDATPGPESLILHLNHAVYEGMLTRVAARAAADFDRQVDEVPELRVVQRNVLFSVDNSASHWFLPYLSNHRRPKLQVKHRPRVAHRFQRSSLHTAQSEISQRPTCCFSTV